MNKKIITSLTALLLAFSTSVSVFADSAVLPDDSSALTETTDDSSQPASSQTEEDTAPPAQEFVYSNPDAVRSGDYEYIINDRRLAVITRYVGNSAHVEMPETIDGNLIAEIGEDAFRDSLISSVILGRSVTSIGARAFLDCPNLTSVILSEKVNNIGEYAFGYTEPGIKLNGFSMSAPADTAASAYAAANGIEFSVHRHDFNAGFIFHRATCAHEGKMALYCKDCGYRHMDPILKYPHNFTKVIEVVPPTLTEEGYTLYRCKICSATKKKDIKPKLSDLSGAEISGLDQPFFFTGSPVEPVPTVRVNGTTLVKDTDFTVSYANNNAVGTASLTVTGKGGYTGSKTVRFSISQARIEDCKAGGLKDCYKYTGKARKPKPVLTLGSYTLVENTDYTLTYSNNVNIGTAKITVTGKGSFTGSTEIFFPIVRQGWYTENGRKYYYDSHGNKIIGQIYTIDGSQYYFNSDGVMQTSWQKIGGQYYFFGRRDGKRVLGQSVDDVVIGSDGTIYPGTWTYRKIDTMITAHKIVEENTLPTDSMETKRLKVFKWLFPFPYHRFRLLAPIYHQEGWEVTFANDIFRYRSGCCVSEAAACAFMFHEIGYETVYVAHDTSHAWVEMNGRVYDPLFAEAKSFSANYDVIIPQGQYRSNPVQRRKI